MSRSRYRTKPVLTKKMVAILALICAAAVIITAIVFLRTNVLTSYESPMEVQVVDHGRIGFDLNTSLVDFGKMRPGMENTHYFNATNSRDEPVRVVLKAFGEMAPWVVFTPPVTYLEPHTNKIITIACVTPRNAKPGNYTGTLQVFYMKPDAK